MSAPLLDTTIQLPRPCSQRRASWWRGQSPLRRGRSAIGETGWESVIIISVYLQTHIKECKPRCHDLHERRAR